MNSATMSQSSQKHSSGGEQGPDGITRSVKNSSICYYSPTLHLTEDRMRGYAFEDVNNTFYKRYFIMSKKQKTLTI
jgi:hypothetical protein